MVALGFSTESGRPAANSSVCCPSGNPSSWSPLRTWYPDRHRTACRWQVDIRPWTQVTANKKRITDIRQQKDLIGFAFDGWQRLEFFTWLYAKRKNRLCTYDYAVTVTVLCRCFSYTILRTAPTPLRISHALSTQSETTEYMRFRLEEYTDSFRLYSPNYRFSHTFSVL